MASITLNSHGFPAATNVNVYPAENLVGVGPPSGAAVTSAAVSAAPAEQLTFDGLEEGRRYIAYSGGRAVSFFVPPGSTDTLRPITGQEAQALRLRARVLTGTDEPALDDLGEADTYYQLDGDGNVIVEWVRTSA